ncbi:MAG: mannose-6-phosphate isomerase, class I, partial [Myxococcaceae bacterium]
MLELLENTIQPYAWGSRTAIADLLGLPSPSEAPQAELWMGAHPGAPSKVRGGVLLSHVIEREAAEVLGAESRAQFGDKLPFLLKVLAAAEPLSLQAHPSIADAQKGFDDEEQRGVPITAPHRSYKDRNHKPELLCALTPFDALYGFRDVAQTLKLLRSLAVPELNWAVETLTREPNGNGLRVVFERLLTMGEERGAAVEATVNACVRHDGPFKSECSWVERISKLYPGDPGLIVVLLLNLVRLEPGQAIYLPAGNLHAYLDGVGVEIMASSDNVLRGGLTKKHVDVRELLRVLDFNAIPPTALQPRKVGAEDVYDTPAPEFRLSRVD